MRERWALQHVAYIALGTAMLPACGARDDSPPPPRVPVIAKAPAPAQTATLPEPVATEQPVTPPAAGAVSEEEITRAFFAIASDPPPPKITLDTHFTVSNEDRPQVYRDRIAGRGGAYVGVGAEQGLLFAGWARAERMFLLDFDEWVVVINEIHGLVLEHANTPDEVHAYWALERRDDIRSWLAERTPNAADLERKMRIYDRGRPQVQYRLKWLKQRLTELNVPFFGNDQAELDHVANLWRTKRARAVRGDLTMQGALRAFGDLARRASWTVRVLYLSNAEQYFDYETGHFRDNVASLPFDDRSVVLHTTPTRKVDYFYLWQDAKTFVTWAARVPSFRDLMYEAKMPYRTRMENGTWWLVPP